MSNFWFAFLLTLVAGLSTGIGSAIAFFAKRTNYRFLSVATGFSAGVMLYVSFVEIMPKASEKVGEWWMVGSFFIGMMAMLVIDRLVPSAENPHEMPAKGQVQSMKKEAAAEAAGHPHEHHHKLMRMGVLTAVAITIHNFPEGLVTFLAAYEDRMLGLAIMVAIALHNIPEGISVAIPIYYATGSRRRAFRYSLVSGLAEPLGAIVGFVVLRPMLNDGVLGGLFGGIAGVMVYISLDELLPASRAFGKGHDSLYGLVGGMAVMALSLLVL